MMWLNWRLKPQQQKHKVRLRGLIQNEFLTCEGRFHAFVAATLVARFPKMHDLEHRL